MRQRKLTLGNPSHSPAHWLGSVVALTALGLAKASPRSFPLPANQPTGRSDWQQFRPLPGDLGRAFGIPAIGSLPNHPRRPAFYPHQSPDPTCWSSQPEGSFPVLHVMQDSDFPRGNHSFAFALQRTVSCACRARFGIHPANLIN